MSKILEKELIVPVDGSQISFRPADYITRAFNDTSVFALDLLFIESQIPSIMLEESEKNPEQKKWLKKMLESNKKHSMEVLEKAKDYFLKVGFSKEQINAVSLDRIAGVALDICLHAETAKSDAIVISTHGKSKLEAFFMGETASKVLEASRITPVWFIKGIVKKEPAVLIGVDCSENAMRASDHAAFMFKGTGMRIILYHSINHRKRFFSKEVMDSNCEISEICNDIHCREIAPYMDRARGIFLDHGFKREKIVEISAEGTKNTALDILSAASEHQCNTIVMGKKGATNSDIYALGSVPKKLLEAGRDLAFWIVP